MKSIKRLAVIALALIMCLGAMSIPSFAAFEANAKLDIAFNNVGDEVFAIVTTDVACGAMKGKITYSENLQFIEKKSRFVEDALTNEMYAIDEDRHTIEFLVLSNRPQTKNGGSTNWAALCFKIKNSATNIQQEISFKLTDAEVCTVGGNSYNINSNAVKIDDCEETFKFEKLLNGLGAQWRPEKGTVKKGIRFGTSIIRTYKNMVNEGTNGMLRSLITVPGYEGDKYAVVVGHTVAYKDKLDADDSGIVDEAELEAQLKAKLQYDTVKIASPINTNAVCKEAVNAYNKQPQFLTYTVAVTGSNMSLRREVVARPYVIWKDGPYGKYYVYNGPIMTTTYDEVSGIGGALIEVGVLAGALS